MMAKKRLQPVTAAQRIAAWARRDEVLGARGSLDLSPFSIILADGTEVRWRHYVLWGWQCTNPKGDDE